MTRLLIIGAGGHGAVVAEAAAEVGQWSEIVFLDDTDTEGRVLEFPILGKSGDLSSFLDGDTEVFVAIGDNRRRLELLRSIAEENARLATVIHPTACISPSASVSSGTVACAGVIVNARATVGLGCILNTAATIDHDCAIEDGVHISPGANLAGNVHVGTCTWIGIGSSIREGIRIGRDSMVGAGSAVVSDVADGATVGGVPARALSDT
jgi:sugar O-acyltransferase (sialic acid O-acetyltransferase NeuD family)